MNPPPERPAVNAHQPHALAGELGENTPLARWHIVLERLAHSGQLVVPIIEIRAHISVHTYKALKVLPHPFFGRRPAARRVQKLRSKAPNEVVLGVSDHCLREDNAGARSSGMIAVKTFKSSVVGQSYLLVCSCEPRCFATGAGVGRLAGR
jgi:hypothetical protein